MEKKKIIIVGGGPAGLMAADILSAGHSVSIYEKENNVGQKLLLAGKGGLNITHDVQGEQLTCKYAPAGFMDKSLMAFDTMALRQWFALLGIPTYTGSSGRVFPEKGILPIDVLNKIRAKLVSQDVLFYPRHNLVHFDANKHVTFSNDNKEVTDEADYIIFALGGASWPVTGSDGSWRSVFESMDISTSPFQSSNCGLNISWPDSVRQNHTGKPVKNIRLFTGDFESKGEAVLTDYGLEGNAVYDMVPAIRSQLNDHIQPIIYIDFKPLNSAEQLLQRTREKEVGTRDYGKLFNLNTLQLALIKAYTDKDTFQSLSGFVNSIKRLTIPVDSLRPVEEAISTIGGIQLHEVNEDFSLKKYPWIYVVGEMLDWDAPTGGFLIQGCFSMAHYAAKSILRRVEGITA